MSPDDQYKLIGEIAWRLGKVVKDYPASYLEVLKISKHVKFAIEHPTEVKMDEVLRHSTGQMYAMIVQYPDFEQYLRPIIMRIESETRKATGGVIVRDRPQAQHPQA